MKNKIALNKLELNKKGKVVNLKCGGLERRRLLDLGIVKNTIITPIFKSPFGTPVAYEIRKTVIAIREEDSKKIEVEEIE